MKSLNIILRTCAVVKILSKTSKRPFGLDKEVLILKSLKSLLESCSHAYNDCKMFLDVVDDSSSEEFRAKMISILNRFSIPYKVHNIQEKNNGRSMKYCYDLALKSKSEIIYFCEDDYLHLKNEIPFVMRAYSGKVVGSSKFVVHPTDYPDRYVKVYPAYIFLSKDCHWRSISHTTGTFFIPKNVFVKYKQLYYKFAEINSGKVGGGEDITVNKVYEEVPCLSPIPSLAAHMNDDTLPPFVDWAEELNRIAI